MRLRLFGDPWLVAHVEHGWVPWTVNPVLPLGGSHNVSQLLLALDPDAVRKRTIAADAGDGVNNVCLDDVAFVRLPNAGTLRGNDSASSLWELLLAREKGSPLPRRGLDLLAGATLLDPSRTAVEQLLEDGDLVLATSAFVSEASGMISLQKKSASTVAEALRVVSLSGSNFRFAAFGSAVAEHDGGRKVTKQDTAASSVASWAGSFARCNLCLDGTQPQGGRITFSIQLDEPGALGPLEAREAPRVCVGVCDGNIDDELHSDGLMRISANYPQCWMLDVLGGGIYAGKDTRPVSLVDSHHLRIGAPPGGGSAAAPSLETTLVLDAEKGTLTFLYQGRSVGGTVVPRHLADSLFPCVEIFTPRATVSIV